MANLAKVSGLVNSRSRILTPNFPTPKSHASVLLHGTYIESIITKKVLITCQKQGCVNEQGKCSLQLQLSYSLNEKKKSKTSVQVLLKYLS